MMKIKKFIVVLFSFLLLFAQINSASAVSVTDSSCSATVNSSSGVFIKSVSTYCYLVFTNTGSNSLTIPAGVTSLDLLIIAGGGAGGSAAWGGGGGAGEVVLYSNYSVTPSATLSVSIGAGGTSGGTSLTPSLNRSNSGTDSWVGSSSGVVAKGGGAGASYAYGSATASDAQGSPGGSGGGGTENSANTNVGGSSIATSSGSRTGYGSNGGAGSFGGSTQSGGGGGGSGAVGTAGGNKVGGPGGNGTNALSGWITAISSGMSTSWQSATSTGRIAGGGGGGTAGTSLASGGLGGGGRGAIPGAGNAPGAGVANTGSGGGGASYPTNNTAGAGGSGLIIIRYVGSQTLSTPATPTANPSSGTLKSIAVSWTAVTNASNYTLKLYASNGTTLLATITGLSGTSRTITTSDYASLADGTSYQVSITAIGNGSTFLDSSESSKRSVTTSQTLSNASLSSATPTSATLKSINLAWSAVSNASNYTIKIYDSSNTLLETLTNVSGTSKTISTSDYSSLADSTTYKFSIQAIGNNTSYLSSSESSLISATTHSPVTVTINRSLTNPYSSRSLSYTFTFSESVTGFSASNLSVSGTSTGWSLGTLSGSGSSYSITLTNSSPIDGTINLTLDNSGIAAVSSSVQPATTSASTFTLGKASQVTTWIKFLWGEDLQRF